MVSTTMPAPSPISVPTSQGWDNDGAGLWSTFIVDVGTPPQPGRVIVSTAGDETWLVVAAGCPPEYPARCPENRGKQFSPDNSTSWTNISLYTLALEENLGYSGNGQFGHDIVSLGYPGSGGPSLINMVVAGIATPDFWLGQFGLDPAPSNFTTLNDPQPSFLWTLNNTRAIPSTSWAYTAGAIYRNNKEQGSLTLGGYDASKFLSSNNVTFPFYNDVSRRYIVDLTTITYIPTGVSTITSTTTLMSQKIPMLIDSTIPYIYLPLEMCTKFESAFGLQYDDDNEIYTVNETMHKSLVDMNPAITFTLANTQGETLDIVIPYAAFDVTASFPVVKTETKYFPLKRAANDTQYTLGRVFLQEAYMIADFERSEFTVAPCVWPATFKQNLVPILLPSINSVANPPNNNITVIASPSPAPSHRISIGPIIGGVVGGVGFVLVGLILAYLFIWKPRHRNKLASVSSTKEASDSRPPTEPSGYLSNQVELESKECAQELLDIKEIERQQKHEMPGVPAGQELDTHVPVGSELDSPQIYEMPAREQVASEMGSPVLSQRSVVSPLSPDDLERRGMRHQTYYNP